MYHFIVNISKQKYIFFYLGCAEPNYPGVYARVNRYRTWIKSNTKDACYCDPED